MIIDITSLKVIRSSDSHFRIAMTKATGQYIDYPTFFCIDMHKEWPMVRACMMGFAEVYPYFADGTYALRFTPSGMQVMYSDAHPQEYFTFPTSELVDYIDWLVQQVDYKEWRDDPDELHQQNIYDGCIKQWVNEYAPKVDVRYHEGYDCNDMEERIALDESSPLLSEPVKRGLVAQLTQIAGNYSDGNANVVDIYFDERPVDGKPTSYYFDIRHTDGGRIMNGGWIAHRHDIVDGIQMYRYSMHT